MASTIPTIEGTDPPGGVLSRLADAAASLGVGSQLAEPIAAGRLRTPAEEEILEAVLRLSSSAPGPAYEAAARELLSLVDGQPAASVESARRLLCDQAARRLCECGDTASDAWHAARAELAAALGQSNTYLT